MLVAAPEEGSAWTLQQDGAAVGRLRTDADPAIVVPGEAWNVDLHRGGSGWWAQMTRNRTGETITYRPRVLSGGDFDAAGSRYRLRSRILGGWRLRDDSRGEIARFKTSGGVVQTISIELGPSAAREPRLATLILAASLAIVWNSMTPRVGGDGGGP
jgi:hypothetical protein